MNGCWNAEFAGLFWGEGNFMIDLMERKIPSKRRLADGTVRDYGLTVTTTARLRVRIIQREDDRAVLEHIMSVLGGHIYVHKSRMMVSGGNGKSYQNHKALVWQSQHKDEIENILDILDQSTFPCKKRREVSIMREALAVMRSRRHGYTPEAWSKLHELKDQLSNIRKFNGG